MTRWPDRWLCGVLALALGGAALGLTTPSATADGTGPAFHTSPIIGGGFISVVAQAPDGTIIAGGDTEGFFRSVDGGQTWTSENAGLPPSGYHVAALLVIGTTWYAAVGDGGNGGIARSVDDGVTWTELTHAGSGTPPLFDGANLPGQTGNPRATGDLLATDGTFLYAASFGHGLERWALTSPRLGASWQCVALCTSNLNALALDGKGDAFVSIIARTGASQGVDEITGLPAKANTKVISTRTGISSGVQELISLGARIYVAGANGIGYWSAGKWVTLDASKHWYTLSGYETKAGASPNDTLYAATYTGTGSKDVERLSITGTSAVITGLVPSGSVSTNVYGTATPWWEATEAGTAGQNLGPSAMIGGCISSTLPLCAGLTTDFFAGSNLAVLTHNGGSDVLLVAGRSGIWHYDPSTSPPWSPAVTGLGATFELAVAVDPANAADVAASDADWNVLASTDGMADVDTAVDPPLVSMTSGTALGLTWDTSVSPSALILSGGSRAGNNSASIWYDAAWATGGSWSSIPLPSGVSTRPMAIAAEPVGPGVYVLVVAFQNNGVYAFTGSSTTGTWAEIANGASGGPTISPTDLHGVSLAWAVDGSAVFMYDAGTHAVWESTVAAGIFAPWVEVYADTSVTPGRGWVTGDPVTPTVVWLSNTAGLGYIDTAACTTACTPTWVVTGTGGPLASVAEAAGDYVYMAGGGPAPEFWEVQVTGCAVTCPAPTGYVDPFYNEVAGNGIALAAGSDGTVYLATQGNGMAVATAP